MKSVTTVVALAICSFFTGTSAFAQAPVPPTTVSFDGFCDGISLTFGNGKVGGVLTGCYAGEGIAGGEVFATSLSGGAEMQVTSTILPGCVVNYYFDVPAKTWANFETCDGSPQFQLNAGTFSYTQPKDGGPGSAAKK